MAFTHPGDLLATPGLSDAEKRAVLASWASDARAVEDAPQLRRLDDGAVVRVAEILRTLQTLDGAAPADEGGTDHDTALPQPFPRRRRAWAGIWRDRLAGRRRRSDDDDPPPCPAVISPPPRRIRTEAWSPHAA